MYKYRTMVKDAEKDGIPRTSSANDDRITRFGRLMRKRHLKNFVIKLDVDVCKAIGSGKTIYTEQRRYGLDNFS